MRWAELVDTAAYPKPRVALPPGVEKTKSKLFRDKRWFNRMSRYVPLSMASVGKITQTAWKEAHETTLDYSRRLHHVSLDRVHGIL